MPRYQLPVEGQDYQLRRVPFRSTPFVTVITCKHCDYTTGRTYETGAALQDYGKHWLSKRHWDS